MTLLNRQIKTVPIDNNCLLLILWLHRNSYFANNYKIQLRNKDNKYIIQTKLVWALSNIQQFSIIYYTDCIAIEVKAFRKSKGFIHILLFGCICFWQISHLFWVLNWPLQHGDIQLSSAWHDVELTTICVISKDGSTHLILTEKHSR